MAQVLAFPLVLVWRLLEALIGVTGRVLLVVVGLSLLVVGGLLTVTVVGAILGVPLALLGVLLLIRAIF
jgi:hypothetical protein